MMQEDDDGLFEVEKIVQHRQTPGKKDNYQLFIKWFGYPASDNTWEPLQDIYETIPGMVDDYFLKENKKAIVDKKTGKTKVISLEKKVSPNHKASI